MLKRFGFGRDAPADKKANAPLADPLALQQQLRKHREMVRVAVKGTLNQYGMGATWVGCEVNPLHLQPQPGGAADAVLIRLIIQVWREDLLRYLPALQKKILASLDAVEPGIDHSHHRVSWEFAPDCGCTVLDLPPAASWSGNRGASDKTGAPMTVKRRFDLPPSDFDQARDERDDIPSTFAATQTGFLNTDLSALPKNRK